MSFTFSTMRWTLAFRPFIWRFGFTDEHLATLRITQRWFGPFYYARARSIL